MTITLQDAYNFPAACAWRAALAARQVLAGELPEVEDPGNYPHIGQYVRSIHLDARRIEVETYAPSYSVDGEAPYCRLIADRDGNVVFSFEGLTVGGYRYLVADEASPQVCVWRDDIPSDIDDTYGSPYDLGSRTFVPAVARWAARLGLEPSAWITATAEAAARELEEVEGGE